MDTPQIFTFYSFKGGVGRSMALINVAYSLASKGRNVLILDMDLEAPGLSGFLRRNHEIGEPARFDMVDVIRFAAELSGSMNQASSEIAAISLPSLSDIVVSFKPDRRTPVKDEYIAPGRLDVIPIDEDRDYYSRLNQLAIGHFDRNRLIRVGNTIRRWIKDLGFPIETPEYYGPTAKRSGKYDFVFIDSRTGGTEAGGLCIGPLSDRLVVFCSLNDQNVEGTRGFLEEIGVIPPRSHSDSTVNENEKPIPKRIDTKPTMIVASPVPIGEIEFKRARLKILESAIGQVDSVLTYHPRMSLMESIFTRDFPEEFLCNEYEKLTKSILDSVEIHVDLEMKLMFRSGLSPELSQKFKTFLTAFPLDSVRLHSKESEDRTLFDILVYYLYKNRSDIYNDNDFMLYDSMLKRIFVKVPPGIKVSSSGDFDPILERAENLSRWSLITEDADLHKSRFDAAFKLIQSRLDEIPPGEGYFRVLLHRAKIYIDHRKYDRAISDCSKIIDSMNKPSDLRSKAFFSRGLSQFRLGKNAEAIIDFQESIQINPNDNKSLLFLILAYLLCGEDQQAESHFDRFLREAEPKDIEELKSELNVLNQRYPENVDKIKAMLVKIDQWKPSEDPPLVG